MKRFYKEAAAGACEEGGAGFAILLDGKPVRTPEGHVLRARTVALAQAVADEWAAQGARIDPQTMPLTQILSTCLDRAQTLREDLSQTLSAWIDTDLLCYRAPSSSPLAGLQAAAWDPWLAAFARRFGVALATTAGLCALSQPPEAVQAVQGALAAMDDAAFTAVQIATALSGSVVLALALARGEAGAQAVFDAAHVEEDYHARVAGEDVQGRARDVQRRRDATLRDLMAVERFMALGA